MSQQSLLRYTDKAVNTWGIGMKKRHRNSIGEPEVSEENYSLEEKSFKTSLKNITDVKKIQKKSFQKSMLL